jgi:acyl-coenzyme A thioesterase PaaI-like protein
MVAFYEHGEGAALVATVATRGPWSPGHQHGGPPTALMVRAAQLACPGRQVARITAELVRPVPIGPVTVELAVERRGRRTTQLRSAVVAGGVEVMSARILFVEPVDVAVPNPVDGGPIGEGFPFTFPFFTWEEGYHRAVSVRVLEGEFGRGDLTAWMEPTIPLVAGEVTTPEQALCVVADAGSGLGLLLDTRRYTFVNADLSIHLLRAPLRGRVVMRSRTHAVGAGRAWCETSLHDEGGPVGSVNQSLIVEAIAPA